MADTGRRERLKLASRSGRKWGPAPVEMFRAAERGLRLLPAGLYPKPVCIHSVYEWVSRGGARDLSVSVGAIWSDGWSAATPYVRFYSTMLSVEEIPSAFAKSVNQAWTEKYG